MTNEYKEYTDTQREQFTLEQMNEGLEMFAVRLSTMRSLTDAQVDELRHELLGMKINVEEAADAYPHPHNHDISMKIALREKLLTKIEDLERRIEDKRSHQLIK